MLNWANRFSIFCLLDNHQYQIHPHSVECMLAAGMRRSFSVPAGRFEDLQAFIDKKPGWLFGHLGYDLKNEIDGLNSSHPDYIGFPDLFFFEPMLVIRLGANEITIEGDDAEKHYYDILNSDDFFSTRPASVSISNRFSREEYITVISKLHGHILRGDCYEINFCQEFFADNAEIDPVAIYHGLSAVSPNPFSALYKLEDRFLICASPERYLCKSGQTLLSQPIKGTARRNTSSDAEDLFNKEQLYHSQKDRSENVMVVDLVRNDLSKVCKEGTVKTDELYGVYPFPQVYQMISTISGELRSEITFTDILKATFPMGSMTGAPKHSVLNLIERYEKTKRGIFSGAVGYITPAGDFDFNVVIRSIMYNSTSKYLSFQAGSGITFYSDPVKEWEECLLKAEAIRDLLAPTSADNQG